MSGTPPNSAQVNDPGQNRREYGVSGIGRITACTRKLEGSTTHPGWFYFFIHEFIPDPLSHPRITSAFSDKPSPLFSSDTSDVFQVRQAVQWKVWEKLVHHLSAEATGVDRLWAATKLDTNAGRAWRESVEGTCHLPYSQNGSADGHLDYAYDASGVAPSKRVKPEPVNGNPP
ncbi:hypothetical protein PYCCODRAFT_1457405 [Trametes coccinea BRFM310]|uniref:Uncharacterized protein n=1 Tax=Trametes coccinea (strain BRFM310) TaxID=1353009 RepID=A0A1Y2IWA2_TRAC3|nr:hypothetical protein PYCCODRAFT_1457405 [Trametes coccinea BRFM310]